MAKKITRKTPALGRPQLTVAEQARLLKSRSSEFTIQNVFKYGYRNEEDVSNLPPSVLVVGSQNGLTNAADLITIRGGYVLDGSAGNQNDYGIDSSFDFENRLGTMRNLRKWGPNLEARYANPDTGVVEWINIKADLDPDFVANFTDYWDTTELAQWALFVNHSTNVFEWTGGMGTVASVTANTIVLAGDKTIAQIGFYTNAGNNAKYKVLIEGVEYTYTGTSGNTFTGVTPDPLAGGVAAGDTVVQSVATTAGSDISTNGSGNLGSFVFDLISSLENQVWYGSFANNAIYTSKTNDYTDVTYSTPARLPAQGAMNILDAAPVAFVPQATQMQVSAGLDQWWVSQKIQQTIDVAGVATPTETLYMSRIRTARRQGAQSQGLVGRYKNSSIFVSNEPIINSLGFVQNILQDPQFINISDPIKFDIDAYDFTGGNVFYDNYFIYVSVPQMGVVRMFNVEKRYWEMPQVLPVGRFYQTGPENTGRIFGHSALTNESYLLFEGKSDNGNPINFVAAFPYVSFQGGSPTQKKSFNKIYTEGYIAANTTVVVTVNYDFGGFSGTYTTIISGSDASIIFNSITDGSIGRSSLGSQPIGTILNLPFSPAVPKFRVINTMPRVDFFEYQIVFSTQDDDADFTLLRFGPNIGGSSNMPNSITQ